MSVPVIKGCTVQWKGWSPASTVAVSICAVAAGMIMLVSNNFPASASPGLAPLVTVCGAVSSLVTVITSPFLTVSVSGA